MSNGIELRFDPPNPKDARGKSWEPIEIYIGPNKSAIASLWWETPEMTEPVIINWAKNATEAQRGIIRKKISEITGYPVESFINLTSQT